MAIIPTTEFIGKIAAPTAGYPLGKARNITAPLDGTGTPWIAALINDLFGYQQAQLAAAGLTATGSPDEVDASQYLDSMLFLSGGVFQNVADMKAGDTVKGGSLPLANLVGMRVVWLNFAIAGDKGGNTGVIKSGSPTDNGLTIFTIDGSTYVEADTHLGLSPEQGGAIGNDIANDSVIMTTLLELGGVINLTSEKTYLLGGTNTIEVAGGTTVNGNSASIRFGSFTTDYPMVMRESGTIWHNVSFIGVDEATQNGPSIQNSPSHEFHNCYVSNMGNYGFSMLENTDTNAVASCSDVIFNNCIAEDCGTGFELFPKQQSSRRHITDCTAINCDLGFRPLAGGNYVVASGLLATGCEYSFDLSGWGVAEIQLSSVDCKRNAVSITAQDFAGAYGTYVPVHDSLTIDANVDERSGYAGGETAFAALAIASSSPGTTPRGVTFQRWAVEHFTGSPWSISTGNGVDFPVHFEKMSARGFTANTLPKLEGLFGGGLVVDHCDIVFAGTNDADTAIFSSDGAVLGDIRITASGATAMTVSGDKLSCKSATFLGCDTQNLGGGNRAILSTDVGSNDLNFPRIDIQNLTSGFISNVFGASGNGILGYGTVTAEDVTNLRDASLPIVVDLAALVAIN